MQYINSLTLSLLLGLSGCGYSLQGSGSILPPDIKTIGIPMVENSSTEPGLSTLVTEALRDRFERFGVVNVSENEQSADAILEARIIKIGRKTSTVTASTDSALQYDTTLEVAAELRRIGGGVLWREPHMLVTKSYGTTSDVVVTSSADFSSGNIDSADLNSLNTREVARSQEQEALSSLAEMLAVKIYDEAVSPDF